MDGNGEEEDLYANEKGDYDEYGNWWSVDGDFWPASVTDAGGANEVTKGKGKGAGPQCYRCFGWGHIGRNCPNKGARKGQGGGKGGCRGGGNAGETDHLMLFLKRES